MKMNNTEYAVQYFGKSLNCSQAILYTYSEDLGLDNELALKIASGFGAGMGRQC